MKAPALLALLIGALAAAPLAAQAPPLPLPPTLPPGAEMTAEVLQAPASAEVPEGVLTGGAVPQRRVEGAVSRRAWRIRDPLLTTLAVLAPIRAAWQVQGYTLLLDCETAVCGGFDFRYALDVLAEPAMHVDLGDFRALSGYRAADGAAVWALVSRDAAGSFVQIVTVDPLASGPLGPAALPPSALPSSALPPSALQQAALQQAGGPPGDLVTALDRDGHAPLPGLDFASGGADLPEAEAPALATLAAWMAANPAQRVRLVGHTDASGPQAANAALSRQRAEAVRRRLIAVYGIAPARLTAEGAGSLAPRASNLTELGRLANRRVEAVLDPPG